MNKQAVLKYLGTQRLMFKPHLLGDERVGEGSLQQVGMGAIGKGDVGEGEAQATGLGRGRRLSRYGDVCQGHVRWEHPQGHGEHALRDNGAWWWGR